MLTIPAREPDRFVSGDTVQWTKSLRDFSSSDGWSLKYRLVGDAWTIESAAIVAIANASGGWNIAIASTSSMVGAGTYRLIGWVENLAVPVERHTVIDTLVSVAADLALGDPVTLQSDNQRILAAIDARIAGRITADQESVTVDGTQITRIPITELITLRGVYAARVWAERHPTTSHPRHETRFGRVRHHHDGFHG